MTEIEQVSLEEYLAEQQQLIDGVLNRWVPAESIEPSSIHKAMRYSLFAGGKRIRPILAMAAARAVSDAVDWSRERRVHFRNDPHLFADSRRLARDGQ